MSKPVEIIFLGGGGGRWETIKQNKGTGGFRITTEQLNAHVDPGPGALVRMNQLDIDPWDTNLLVVSHCHPDHYTDSELIIEAMTFGMTKIAGRIIGNSSVLCGNEIFEKKISKYHQSKVLEKHILKVDKSIDIDDVSFIGTKTKHGDPYGVGFRLETPQGIIGYTGDTENISSLIKDFSGVKVLIANVVRADIKVPGHMYSEDIISILNSMEQSEKPELVVIYHMGTKMKEPDKFGELITKRTGILTIPAKIGLKLTIDDNVNYEYLKY
ncbi:MBL fold metallo-hydrolase [Methanococcus voltae]|uniref:Phosphoribosyl 1,2-cyclic phosphodiesterase n=2 Tax=Methanococcus voltae TaxID=2188 RepID=A0A8J7RIK3_METVO|nr:MBL fold metallo-hydrolase [Methanococcus voltae]MBP2172527.1 phosphoribosyl 1,2-cyclic phosphodiesterase [Methanococcus voltae]MBP2201566.1 phosphoribosyl 1,2-cyclic phosphodiesterase [Methanococcus voltae]MCS3922355.1 phosphoribosyl 1,2-cyclic phosphodiesterase [Methanococcus voltae PS]